MSEEEDRFAVLRAEQRATRLPLRGAGVNTCRSDPPKAARAAAPPSPQPPGRGRRVAVDRVDLDELLEDGEGQLRCALPGLRVPVPARPTPTRTAVARRKRPSVRPTCEEPEQHATSQSETHGVAASRISTRERRTCPRILAPALDGVKDLQLGRNPLTASARQPQREWRGRQ